MTNTAPSPDDYRDLRPKGRRASDPDQIQSDGSISALDYGRLCSLLQDEQRRLLRMTAGSRIDWARVDGRCQALAEVCAMFSGIDPDDLRRRLSPREDERRAS